MIDGYIIELFVKNIQNDSSTKIYVVNSDMSGNQMQLEQLKVLPPIIKILNPSSGVNGSWKSGDIIALNWEMQNIKESHLSVYIVDRSDKVIMSKTLLVSDLRKIYNGSYLYEFNSQ
jgi:hypothetical protein